MAADLTAPRRALFRLLLSGILLSVTIGGTAAWLWWTSDAQRLKAAGAALDAGQSRSALTIANLVVSRSPQSLPGWRMLARAAMAAEDRKLREQALQQVERLRPGETASQWTEIGLTEMQTGMAAPAEQALVMATRLAPDDATSWRRLAQLYSVQGRARNTAACLGMLIQLQAYTKDDLIILSHNYATISDPDRVDAMLKADPENLRPMLGHVGTAINENRLADAEGLLKKVVARHPDDAAASALLGRLLAERAAPEFLVWRLRYSIQLANEPEAFFAQAIWLHAQKQYQAEARLLHRAVELDPRFLPAVAALGRAMQILGHPTEAAKFAGYARKLQVALELSRRIEETADPANVAELVDVLVDLGRLWEASAWCRLELGRDRPDPKFREILMRIAPRLTADLPRTAPESVPGRDFDWSSLPEPVWPTPKTSPSDSSADTATDRFAFEDQAEALGIQFHFQNGTTAPDGARTIAQTSGGGVAAIDYDLDGWCDLHFTQGGPRANGESQDVLDSLFRNQRGTGFEDVTSVCGIREDDFSQGVAVGDVDNDGFPDLCVANLNRNRLFHNQGDGTFVELTQESGLLEAGWTTSMAIADFNGDSHPDLFSVRYVGGPDVFTRVCREPTGRPGICRPTLFPGAPDVLALSTGDGRYTEQIGAAGLDLPEGRGFGLVVADFDDDKRLDIFVANDQTANHLLIQDAGQSAVQFTERAIEFGLAFDRDGVPHAGMGVASGDVNLDGRIDLYISNFAEESNMLYLSEAGGMYLDKTRESRLRDPSFALLGFGTQFLDANLDGRLDLVLLNGHIDAIDSQGKPPEQRAQFFQGLSDSRFAEITSTDTRAGGFFERPRLGRGLCVLDWNRDGLPDFAASCLDGNAALVTNLTPHTGHWVTLQFVGVKASRDAIGTRARLTFEGGTHRDWQLTAGDGFAASNQRCWHVGVGNEQIASLTVTWPGGETQTFVALAFDKRYMIVEGRRGVVPLE